MSLCPECSHYKSCMKHEQENAIHWQNKYDEAVAVLKLMAYDAERHCPFCENWKYNGHTEECRLNKLIGDK